MVNGVDTGPKELIRKVYEENCIEITEKEIIPDPVHLLMEVAPQFEIYRAVKLIKGRRLDD